MSKYAFTLIAGALIAAGNSIMANLDSGAEPTTPAPEPTTPETPADPPKRTRGTKAPVAETPAEAPKPAGKTYEELKTVIEPLVLEGKGAEVKKVIAKYAPDGGGLKELATLPQHHAAFEKDISALSY